MNDREYSDWLTAGNPAAEEKMTICLETAKACSGSMERIGKSACHIIYRAIDGYPITPLVVNQIAGRALDYADFSKTEGRVMKSRWRGSVAIAYAYYAIIKMGLMDEAAVILDSMLEMDAIDSHPQNVLNIQRAALLLAAINIRRGRKEEAGRCIDFMNSAYRRATASVNLRHEWFGITKELQRWVNAVGIGICLGLCNGDQIHDAPFIYDAFMIERQEPFRSAFDMAIRGHGEVVGQIDRGGLAALFCGNAVELGVARGAFSRMILENGRCTKLWSIDRWSDHHDITEYFRAVTTLSSVAPHISSPLRMTFDEALPLFADESLDAIYIDGYANAGQEGGETLENWWPKLKRGGLFSGHDYHAEWPKTIEAVDAFAAKHGFKFSLTVEQEGYPSWFGRKE